MAEIKKVNLYDANAVKNILDDFLRQLVQKNRKLSYNLSNKKLMLGGFGCLVAAVSHFAPIPFPDNIPLLIVCVVLYAIVSVVLEYIRRYEEKDYILETEKYLGEAFKVRTAISDEDGSFVIGIEGVGKDVQVEKSFSIGEFFYSDGILADDILTEKFNRLLHQFEGKSE
eukprot:TRINITY_DN11269_c0_g1_i1.p1 TRINITY_DN11269_c0_g1~~TRINITY_DN11269_c0_g1_i1.p1  ORF type:complete len:170 (+),score=36.37 TRINITY_DN11269_c0_g1_i1:50-559(+)